MMSWLALAGIKRAQNKWTFDVARRAGTAFIRGFRRFFSADKALAEGISGLFTILLAVMLAVAEARDQNFPSLFVMFDIASGYLWMIVAFAAGSGQLAGRVVDDHWRWHWVRWVASIFSAWIWGMMAYSMLRIEGMSPGWLGVASMVTSDAYLSIRILSHAR